jgi:hypothetical protein
MYQFETLPDVILATYIKERIGMESLVVGTRDQLRIQVISKISEGGLVWHLARVHRKTPRPE